MDNIRPTMERNQKCSEASTAGRNTIAKLRSGRLPCEDDLNKLIDVRTIEIRNKREGAEAFLDPTLAQEIEELLVPFCLERAGREIEPSTQGALGLCAALSLLLLDYLEIPSDDVNSPAGSLIALCCRCNALAPEFYVSRSVATLAALHHHLIERLRLAPAAAVRALAPALAMGGGGGAAAGAGRWETPVQQAGVDLLAAALAPVVGECPARLAEGKAAPAPAAPPASPPPSAAGAAAPAAEEALGPDERAVVLGFLTGVLEKRRAAPGALCLLNRLAEALPPFAAELRAFLCSPGAWMVLVRLEDAGAVSYGLAASLVRRALGDPARGGAPFPPPPPPATPPPEEPAAAAAAAAAAPWPPGAPASNNKRGASAGPAASPHGTAVLNALFDNIEESIEEYKVKGDRDQLMALFKSLAGLARLPNPIGITPEEVVAACRANCRPGRWPAGHPDWQVPGSNHVPGKGGGGRGGQDRPPADHHADSADPPRRLMLEHESSGRASRALSSTSGGGGAEKAVGGGGGSEGGGGGGGKPPPRAPVQVAAEGGLVGPQEAQRFLGLLKQLVVNPDAVPKVQQYWSLSHHTPDFVEDMQLNAQVMDLLQTLRPHFAGRRLLMLLVEDLARLRDPSTGGTAGYGLMFVNEVCLAVSREQRDFTWDADLYAHDGAAYTAALRALHDVLALKQQRLVRCCLSAAEPAAAADAADGAAGGGGGGREGALPGEGGAAGPHSAAYLQTHWAAGINKLILRSFSHVGLLLLENCDAVDRPLVRQVLLRVLTFTQRDFHAARLVPGPRPGHPAPGPPAAGGWWAPGNCPALRAPDGLASWAPLGDAVLTSAWVTGGTTVLLANDALHTLANLIQPGTVVEELITDFDEELVALLECLRESARPAPAGGGGDQRAMAAALAALPGAAEGEGRGAAGDGGEGGGGGGGGDGGGGGGGGGGWKAQLADGFLQRLVVVVQRLRAPVSATALGLLLSLILPVVDDFEDQNRTFGLCLLLRVLWVATPTDIDWHKPVLTELLGRAVSAGGAGPGAPPPWAARAALAALCAARPPPAALHEALRATARALAGADSEARGLALLDGLLGLFQAFPSGLELVEHLGMLEGVLLPLLRLGTLAQKKAVLLCVHALVRAAWPRVSHHQYAVAVALLDCCATVLAPAAAAHHHHHQAELTRKDGPHRHPAPPHRHPHPPGHPGGGGKAGGGGGGGGGGDEKEGAARKEEDPRQEAVRLCAQVLVMLAFICGPPTLEFLTQARAKLPEKVCRHVLDGLFYDLARSVLNDHAPADRETLILTRAALDAFRAAGGGGGGKGGGNNDFGGGPGAGVVGREEGRRPAGGGGEAAAIKSATDAMAKLDLPNGGAEGAGTTL